MIKPACGNHQNIDRNITGELGVCKCYWRGDLSARTHQENVGGPVRELVPTHILLVVKWRLLVAIVIITAAKEGVRQGGIKGKNGRMIE